MSVLNLVRVEVGKVGVLPGDVRLSSTDDLVTITAPGYLDESSSLFGVAIFPTDIITTVYGTPLVNKQVFTPTIVNGVITLVSTGGGGAINNGANLGSGNGIFAAVAGDALTFKSIIAGDNISITPTGTDLTIAALGGSPNHDYIRTYWMGSNGLDLDSGSNINEPIQSLEEFHSKLIALGGPFPTTYVLNITDAGTYALSETFTGVSGVHVIINSPGATFTYNGFDAFHTVANSIIVINCSLGVDLTGSPGFYFSRTDPSSSMSISGEQVFGDFFVGGTLISNLFSWFGEYIHSGSGRFYANINSALITDPDLNGIHGRLGDTYYGPATWHGVMIGPSITTSVISGPLSLGVDRNWNGGQVRIDGSGPVNIVLPEIATLDLGIGFTFEVVQATEAATINFSVEGFDDLLSNGTTTFKSGDRAFIRRTNNAEWSVIFITHDNSSPPFSFESTLFVALGGSNAPLNPNFINDPFSGFQVAHDSITDSSIITALVCFDGGEFNENFIVTKQNLVVYAPNATLKPTNGTALSLNQLTGSALSSFNFNQIIAGSGGSAVNIAGTSPNANIETNLIGGDYILSVGVNARLFSKRLTGDYNNAAGSISYASVQQFSGVIINPYSNNIQGNLGIYELGQKIFTGEVINGRVRYQTQVVSFTVDAAQHGLTINVTSALSVNITVPVSSGNNLQKGFKINLIQASTGIIIFMPVGGVTIRSVGGILVTSAQNQQCSLELIDPNTDIWQLTFYS